MKEIAPIRSNLCPWPIFWGNEVKLPEEENGECSGTNDGVIFQRIVIMIW
jgi:hypothetical protein